MASTKIRDLAVKTGEYTDSQGQTKGRYENIGSLMKSEDGGLFIILKRTFNPAGVINPDDRDSVMISCFAIRDQQRGENQQQSPPQQQQQGTHRGQSANFADFDDDIPF